MSLSYFKPDTRNNGKLKKQLPPQKQVPAQKLKIIDARNKIISKKRTQITDAREKLAELAKQKDARLKLQQLRERRVIGAPIEDVYNLRTPLSLLNCAGKSRAPHMIKSIPKQ